MNEQTRACVRRSRAIAGRDAPLNAQLTHKCINPSRPAKLKGTLTKNTEHLMTHS